MSKIFHGFHLVSLSPWPLVCSISSFSLVVSIVYFFKYSMGFYFLLNFYLLIFFSFLWWRDVSRESSYLGDHTMKVQDNLKWGMLLFILSEVLFFMAWFWSFFHNSLSPVQEIGLVWPPVKINPLDPFSVPLLNTVILLSSGLSVTWSHHNIQKNKDISKSLFLTLFLGFLFTWFQLVEYKTSSFCISDSIFGSVFFVSTGFHGLHVLVGSVFLLVCFLRFLNKEMTFSHHTGFEFAIWYWHFVDVVWLYLFTFIYWWGFF